MSEHERRSLTKNDRPWANRSGRSPKMREWVNRSFFWANRSCAHFFAKNKRFAQKTDERIPSPAFCPQDVLSEGGRSNCNTVINIIKWNTRPGGLQKREKKTKDRDIWELQKYDLHIVLSKFNTAVNKKNSYSKSEKLLGTIMCFCILSHHDPKHQFVNYCPV